MIEASERTRLDVMKELLAITNDMLSNRNDSEVLILGVEHRQDLMDECDELSKDDLTPNQRDEIKRIALEIIEKDKIINNALSALRKESKADLAAAKNRQRIMGYANQAISPSGNYMDYKK